MLAVKVRQVRSQASQITDQWGDKSDFFIKYANHEFDFPPSLGEQRHPFHSPPFYPPVHLTKKSLACSPVDHTVFLPPSTFSSLPPDIPSVTSPTWSHLVFLVLVSHIAVNTSPASLAPFVSPQVGPAPAHCSAAHVYLLSFHLPHL